MWFLKRHPDSTVDGDIWLKPNKVYSVGRKDCDILLESDKSVSRKHAAFDIGPLPSGAVEATHRSSVLLKDAGARLGTRVNGQSVSGSCALKNGDLVEFGVGGLSVFKLVWFPICICISSVSSSAKKSIISIATDNDMRVVPEVTSNCTHLVTSTIKVTMKVVNALSRRIHIVSEHWISCFKDLDSKRFKIPDESLFLPESKDSDKLPKTFFVPDDRRRTLFSEYTFYFLSANDMIMMDDGIRNCGGECHMLDANSILKVMRERQPQRKAIFIASSLELSVPEEITHAFDVELHALDNVLYSLIQCDTSKYLTPLVRKQGQREEIMQMGEEAISSKEGIMPAKDLEQQIYEVRARPRHVRERERPSEAEFFQSGDDIVSEKPHSIRSRKRFNNVGHGDVSCDSTLQNVKRFRKNQILYSTKLISFKDLAVYTSRV